MATAFTYIVLGYANFFGSAPPANNHSPIAPGLIPGTYQGPFQLQVHHNYTLGAGAHTVSTRRTTWNTARRTCQEQGGHLAIVNSVFEAEAIGQLFNESNILYGWVGLHDFFQEDEFVTIHDEPLSQTGFDVWRPGDPNNWKDNEDCVLLSSNSELIDETCTIRHYFVCEFPDLRSFAIPTPTEPGPASETVNSGNA